MAGTLQWRFRKYTKPVTSRGQPMWVAGCAIFSRAGALTERCAEVLQGSCHVEIPSAPECGTASRSDDDRDLVGVSIRLDGKWKYQ